MGWGFPDGPSARAHEDATLARLERLGARVFSGGRPTPDGGDIPTEATRAKKRATKAYRGPFAPSDA